MDNTAPRRKSLDGEESSEQNRERSEIGGSLTSPESYSTQQLPSERDRERSETDGSLTSPESCTIQQLPPEVLAMIFAYSNSTPCYGWNGLNLRLVCKEWCNTYAHYRVAKVYFIHNVPHVRLGNCGFGRLAVQFLSVDLSELPQSMWQKIGYKIHSLELQSCKVGDQVLKNVIMHCCNLQSLEVLLSDYRDDGHSFCSAEMLRELCINKKNLKTFKIISTQRSIDVTNWTEIFKAFLTVFPCIIHYTVGHNRAHCHSNEFEFRFPNEVNVNNLNAIATTLALLLSADNSHYKQAFDVASTLRLVGFSLWKGNHAAEEADEDVATLVKFFSNCNNLECVKIKLNWRISNTMQKSFLLQIIRHCCKLRKLRYSNLYSELRPNALETLIHKLCTRYPSLDKQCVNSFELSMKRSSLSFYSRRSTAEYMPLSEQYLRKTYPNLQHLDLSYRSVCTDEMLQSIFKHLVKLKSLRVYLGHSNTNKGITGNSRNVPDVCTSRVEIISDEDGSNLSGYSINRLKSLEKLVLLGYCHSQMNDTIFYELDFPNLRYLSIDPPDDPSKLFPVMAQNMPSLETINFLNALDNRPESWLRKIIKNFWKSMFPFVRQLKKLRTMKLAENSILNGYERYTPHTQEFKHVIGLFCNSESLHEIAGVDCIIAHHLRDSGKIVIFDCYGKWNIITMVVPHPTY